MKKRYSSGFTIVEVLVVIFIFALLVGLSTFGFRNWQQGLAKTQVQTDLRQATTAMEASKNFGAGYPTAIPSTFKVGQGVTVTFVWGDATRYCLQGASSKYSSVTYYVDTTQGKEPRTGNCPASPIANAGALTSPTISLDSVTNSTATVSWSNVTNATSYTVRYGLVSPTSVFSCSNSPCTITGLSSNTLYKVNVTASNSGGSVASSTINVLTAPSAPSAPTVAYSAGFPSNNVRTYTITASGGTCTQGSTVWKIWANERGDDPNWSSVAWQTSNVSYYYQTMNGFQAPGTVIAYAKPGCTNSGGTTEYASYASY